MSKENNGRRLKSVTVILTFFLVFTSVACAKQLIQLKEMDQQLVAAEELHQTLLLTQVDLAAEKELLNDKTYMERLARERFKLIKPNEYLVVPAETNEEVEIQGDVDASEIH